MVLRTDPTVVPTMMKGATVSLGELEQLRESGERRPARTRRAHRTQPHRPGARIGPDHAGPSARALRDAGTERQPARPIFGADTVTLQLVTRMSLTLSGALQGLLETSGRSTEEKNRLCPPTAWPHTPFDYLRVILAGVATEMGWQDAPELQEFVDRSRLNLIRGLGTATDDDPAHIQEVQARFFAALMPAFDQLGVFADRATPQERARMFSS